MDAIGTAFTRRQLLHRSGMGFGALGLAAMAGPAPASVAAISPLAPRRPHFAGRARHVIHLFMNGGPSHIDTFDPKPALEKYAGKELPFHLQTERKTGAAFPSPFKFRPCGRSGIPVSEIFSHTGERIDDICVIRSMQADVPNHQPSILLMNCGDARLIRPSLGAWVTYGLGAENQNLPGFVAMCPYGVPDAGPQNWRNAFLPGAFQGTHIDTRHTDPHKLIENIRNDFVSPEQQRQQMQLLRQLNDLHRASRDADSSLDARIQNFELAYRMQLEATDAFDISREPQHIREMYGDTVQGRQILIARRLVERGVRFVQVWHSAGAIWDHHDDVEARHRQLAGQCDRAIGALLADLKQRGLLDETLVIWGGEFGRTPTVELPAPGLNAGKANGRDHNHHGFTVWLAGGGVRGGHIHGATDEFGFAAVDKPVHVHDLHATILHLLGFDHERLTYRYAGRDFRLTDVHGHVVRDLLA
jgi:hypothetical protein